jgi:hypothetical protein
MNKVMHLKKKMNQMILKMNKLLKTAYETLFLFFNFYKKFNYIKKKKYKKYIFISVYKLEVNIIIFNLMFSLSSSLIIH